MSIVREIVAAGGYSIENAFIKPSQWVRPAAKIKPLGGVIHWTGNIRPGADSRANRNYFNSRKGSYGSAHLIGDDSKVLAALPFLPNEAEMAYHVGANRYYTQQFGSYPNAATIGYEICVNKDGSFRESYKRAVWTMAYLCLIYKWVPSRDIKRHWDLTRKDCPLPFVDLIYDDTHCHSKGWTFDDVKWMRTHLHIDGIQGEELWDRYLFEVKELTSYFIEINGNIQTKKDEDKMPLQINDYEWKMLNGIWSQRYNNKEISDWKWISKIRSKQLTSGELAFLNSVIAAKQNGLQIEPESAGM
ncbi:N-acetylmuramoyl-L-alanine amidase family protein [Paenibacillus lutrae]|uniref:N-acetylmuramoyl-L-alanine amidase n=1 Tax=Paenibacillus lutrae TaxID=2078573 RepID=A0A7X3FJE8_9BACL|nr:N-acetylmuramoyl-L-alanine amidase [Paenibacillus lutrae]MVP00791.1 hypothetical protein [Paenibacillus lutrae]